MVFDHEFRVTPLTNPLQDFEPKSAEPIFKGNNPFLSKLSPEPTSVIIS
jgi:hypothetical protein